MSGRVLMLRISVLLMFLLASLFVIASPVAADPIEPCVEWDSRDRQCAGAIEPTAICILYLENSVGDWTCVATVEGDFTGYRVCLMRAADGAALCIPSVNDGQ